MCKGLTPSLSTLVQARAGRLLHLPTDPDPGACADDAVMFTVSASEQGSGDREVHCCVLPPVLEPVEEAFLALGEWARENGRCD